MVGRLTLLCALSLVPLTGSAGSGPSARVELRKLSRCVSLSLGAITRVENVALIEAQVHVSRSVKSCGCASDGLRYETFLRYPDGERDILGKGRLETAERVGSRVPIMLVGASDATEATQFSKAFIELTCEIPRAAQQR